MQLIQSSPAELIDTQAWEAFLNSITVGADAPQWTMAYGEILAAQKPHRLMLFGAGAMVAASEYNLDLFRSLTTTISGLEPGGIYDEHAQIRYHPCFHRSDYKQLTEAVERHPGDSFLVVSIDFVVAGGDWLNAQLNHQSSTPWPALNLLRWLHSDWNLSDVSPRVEVLRRWAQQAVPNHSLSLVN